jgi:uncharacterized OB-fold protein
MARGIARAAVYLPRLTDGRRRVGNFDEDAFTFAATALERASARTPADARGVALTTVGLAAAPERASLAVVLGAPSAPTLKDGAEPTLAAALHRASARTGPEWIVVTATDGDGSGGGPMAPPGEGAAALLIDDGPGLQSLDPCLEGDGGAAAQAPLARLFELARAHPDPERWVGDWDAEPTRGAAAPTHRVRLGAPAHAVSQGAFVPMARDEESRPSRWRFVADRCRACGGRSFPARGRCKRCGRTDGLTPEPLPLSGATVVAATWIGQGGQPTEFDLQVEASGPYGVVLAELVPDVRVTLAVTDARPEEVRVGSKVDTVLRRLYPMDGTWRYGRKAVPAPSAPAAPATNGRRPAARRGA